MYWMRKGDDEIERKQLELLTSVGEKYSSSTE